MPTSVQHPGPLLLERYLQPLGITPSRLAASIGLPLHRISELIEGLQPVTPDMAARLALYFDVPAEWWLRHQARFDAAHLAPVEALRSKVTPFEGLSEILVTPESVEHLNPQTAKAEKISMVTFSKDFLAKLRAQAEWSNGSPRAISEKTLEDGTIALVGK